MTVYAPPSVADSSGTGSCFTGRFGGTIDCGGGFVVTTPASQPPHVTLSLTHTPRQAPPPLAPYVANGPAGPCIALGPANPVNATIASWAAAQHLPPCPATGAGPPLPPINPATLAVRFWQTIPLPVPKPAIPPGYAITGKAAYLVTNGTLAPAPYQQPTPLGPLTITARGSYLIDWGDGTLPTWTGPYRQEGRAYPNGTIFHTYDNTGTLTVTVREVWTAAWALGPATGALNTLQTTATIAAFPVDQLQAVITS
jgi:hypothetical protein